MKKTILIFFVFLGLIYSQQKQLYNFIEGQTPEIKITTDIPAGIGLTPQTITLELSDKHSGLNSLHISLVQADNKYELLKQDFSVGTSTTSISLTLPGSEIKLAEGAAELQIRVDDRSLRSNTTEKKILFTVDRKLPRIGVLSLQHVVAQGGAELVVFRAEDENLTLVGTKVGEYTFPAIQAAKIDSRFEQYPDIYASLFALPFGYSREMGEISVFASDIANNTTSANLAFRIAPFRQLVVKPELSDRFLDRIIPRLLPQYAALSGEEIDLSDTSPEAKAKNFRLINEGLRGLNDKVIKEITTKYTAERYWNNVFNRSMAGSLSSNLGEMRHYQYQGKEVSFSVHLGLDIASVVNDNVRAAHRGKVVFTDNLGIYGNTVILDHGLGLFTIYSHLASIQVNVEEMLEQGAILGLSGETGLAGGDHLHFEFRLVGIPVTPIEWWDAKWVVDHFDGKLDYVYENLNL